MTFLVPATRQRYTREEYWRWRERQPQGRYERIEGEIVAMAPERAAHVEIKGAIYRTLFRAVETAGVACRALTDGITVETGEVTTSRTRS